MDTKWKSNHKKRILAIIVLLCVTFGTILFFPSIQQRGEKYYQDEIQLYTQEANSTINEKFFSQIYKGCYVLYKEEQERVLGTQIKASELFIESYPTIDGYSQNELREMTNSRMNQILTSWTATFEDYRAHVDYSVLSDSGNSNTSNPLNTVQPDLFSDSDLTSYYKEIFTIHFTENGVMEVDVLYMQNTKVIDEVIKELGKIDRTEPLITDFIDTFGTDNSSIKIKKPHNFTVVFAVPRVSVSPNRYSGTGSEYINEYWVKLHAYRNAGAGLLYGVAFVLLLIFCLYMGSRRVWKDDVMIHRPGKYYMMEAAIMGVCCVFALLNSLVEMIWTQPQYQNIIQFFSVVFDRGLYEALIPVFQSACFLFVVYATWYISICFIRPVLVLGIKQYIKQYSLFYQIFPWLKGLWNRFIYEIQHIDFSEKSVHAIFKLVLINFIVLVVISIFWFVGIIGLVIYSIGLFYLLRKNYDKIRKDYRTLLKGVNCIAEGDLNTNITEDLGVFEPFRNELSKIRIGFKKAVDAEIKSQRMKTELITNVSHDLKTPLTAITTYIELLKKEDITPEERCSYIETLEKKSLRLKVLIEDLFEISKVSSNTIILNQMELDVVNLLKQVSVEHTEKFQQRGIDLRWNIPSEKVIVLLDNQKTYRIFENLFVNIGKYAMSYSRVYIDIRLFNDKTQIILKNISAAELNINADEITERFVRGDSSRNTDGSGLGLAIAKSLTEAQKGKFGVEIDGDLFKVQIEFPLLKKTNLHDSR